MGAASSAQTGFNACCRSSCGAKDVTHIEETFAPEGKNNATSMLQKANKEYEAPTTTITHNVLMAVDPAALEELKLRLQRSGIDTSLFGQGKAKSLEELFWEINVVRDSMLLNAPDGSLKRIVSVVRIKLFAQDMFGTWQYLVSSTQFLHDGRQRNRKDVLSRKVHVGETWQDAVRIAFTERVGLNEDLQAKHIVMDPNVPPGYYEKEEASSGFPGLTAQFQFRNVEVHIADSTHPDLRCIGLPEGREFATMKGTFGDNNFGSRLRMWQWEHSDQAPAQLAAPSASPGGAGGGAKDEEIRRRVPTLNPLEKGKTGYVTEPNSELRSLLVGIKTDWERCNNAARRIREPAYSLKNFHDDMVAAFPELKLYLAAGTTTSGRTSDDEYQRTIGALFAIYWLIRLDIDGKEGFSWGVDDEWKPKRPVCDDPALKKDIKSRVKFYQETQWNWFTELFVISGILIRNGKEYKQDEERLVAMLALTAIHDIMKVDCLLPVVSKDHKSYRGYAAGDKIGDHDAALGYVLEKFPDVLPSFHGLKPASRKAVEFTQSKLDYNQGWLVQAEAPPGVLFGSFKEVLRSGASGGTNSADVSFYFVHWLTDLAGAEPYPMEGAEKFVLRFPHQVLQAFMRSFPLVQELAVKSETEVLEKYLCTRWQEQQPSLGALPHGEPAIAMMRLICQAQANADKILKAFQDLSPDDKLLLGREMARTGCPGQKWSKELSPEEEEKDGPAMLVYYAPALLQKAGNDAPAAIKRLCEIYKQARMLWPATPERFGEHVTIRIDTLKDKSHQEIREAMADGNVFMLVKHNDKEAFVETHPLDSLNAICENMGSGFRFLQVA